MAYCGWKITDDQREDLLARFPARFPDTIAHHITLALKGYVPEAADVVIVGYVSDDIGLETMVVAVNGEQMRRDGSRYHITWSIDREIGYKPVDSNKIMRQCEIEYFDEPIAIATVPFWVDDHKNEHF
jgi:hypothetical protein